MTQTATQAPRVVPYDVFQREHEKRMQAEQKCKKLQDEIFLLRKIRRAPVLRPVDKDVLEEFHHVQQWGIVEDAEGNKRANYTTIAANLHISPDTVKRSAERLEKLHLADIREHQGPQDERERKYIQVKEDRLTSIDTLEDPAGIVPKQGGNRYICTKCDSPDVDVKTEKRTTIRCNCCQHEEVVEDTIGTAEWKSQFIHKRQKQLASENKQVINEQTGEVIEVRPSKHVEQVEAVKATCFSDETEPAQPVEEEEAQKQLAGQSVYTQSIYASASSDSPQKQLAFLAELKSLPLWCCHREKVPYNVTRMVREFQKAKSNDPRTWTTYDQAQSIYKESQAWKVPFDGIGVMNNGDYTFIDLDQCRDKETGELSEVAQEAIALIDSYTELSYSETGIHIIARGSVPKDFKKPLIEMYNGHRFFVWTGKHLANTPEQVEERQEKIEYVFKIMQRIIAPIVPEQVEEREPVLHKSEHVQQCVSSTCSSSDEEILHKGKDDSKFMDLYYGRNIGKYYQKKDGSPDYSRADLALCKKITYCGAGGDVSTIDRIFRQSGLYREKWERDDYRTPTISKAIGQNWQEAS